MTEFHHADNEPIAALADPNAPKPPALPMLVVRVTQSDADRDQIKAVLREVGKALSEELPAIIAARFPENSVKCVVSIE